MTTFSVCIPNFNYARYLPETIESVLAQEGVELEVLVSDNASTDDSVAIIEAIGDPRVRVSVNRANVGFAANLDRAAHGATGEYMLMLSSDDLMRPDALACYHQLFDQVGSTAVVSSSIDVVDGASTVIGASGPDPVLWGDAEVDRELSRALGHRVLRLPAPELLRRCLRTMRNPFNFLATAYPRALYEAVEGYGAGRLMNPDKWFHWRLLGVAETAFFVDAPLFAYRWHASNQTAIQSAQGALKFLVDDYVNTFETPDELLHRAGLGRDDLVAAFVEHDIGRHGLATLARGDRTKARRILLYGLGTHPHATRRNRKALVLGALVVTGPVGQRIAAAAYSRADEARDVRG